MNEPEPQVNTHYLRLRLAIAVSVVGLILYILGVKPGWFGMDLSPVVGFVQIAVFMIGLALICLGGNLTLNYVWEIVEGNNQKTIVADIGNRLVSTGYVIAAAAAMADTFGFGSQPFPAAPYFGQWQAIGLMVGEIIIAAGFFMMIPFPKPAVKE